MALDYRKVRYFVAVYEEGSVSRAAERERVVQPAVSTQIKQLEQEFSVRLFQRASHGMEPTPAGDQFYKLCKQLLHDLGSARQRMLDLGGQIAGIVRLGIMPSLCRGPLSRVLSAYTAAYPHVDLTIVEATSGILAAAVMAGDLDGAIREMIDVRRPVIFDCCVANLANCFPMIPSGRAHNEMLLGDAAESIEDAITEEGKMLV